MNNLNSSEETTINKFFQTFTDATTNILGQTLDEDVFQKYEFTVISSKISENLSSLHGKNVIYKVDYAKGIKQSTIGIIIPEDFIAGISDVFMGGSGDKPAKETLSELEINAVKDIFKKVLTEVENVFKNKFNNELAFATTPILILKESQEYEKEFNSPSFDFVVEHLLKINDKIEHKIYVLMSSEDIKEILMNLKLLDDDYQTKSFESDTIGIKQLSDVKISITAELGHAKVPIKYALELVRGSVVELDTLINSDIKVFANGVEVAYAQIVAVEDSFGLRITKILSPEERFKRI